MWTETLHRLAAAALMAGGLMLGYASVSHPSGATPDVLASAAWIAIHALFMASLMAGLLGATGLYLLAASRTGLPGLAGFLSVFVGMILIAGLDYYEYLIVPHLAAVFPAVIDRYGAGHTMGPVAVVFPLSGLLTVAGFAVLGGVTLAGRRAAAATADRPDRCSGRLRGRPQPRRRHHRGPRDCRFVSLSLIWVGAVCWRRQGAGGLG